LLALEIKKKFLENIRKIGEQIRKREKGIQRYWREEWREKRENQEFLETHASKLKGK